MSNLSPAKIKVIGVGGGGGNAVSHMVSSELGCAEFYAVNTDIQDLHKNLVPESNRVQIGAEQTQGYGAGANPEKGKLSAENDIDAINEAIGDTDMLFIAAGMGGGTGTGAAPVIAKSAKEKGVLTVAVVTKPFSFEGTRRMSYAEEGLENLKEHVDSIIVIPNDKLLREMPELPLGSAFMAVNDVLGDAIKGVSEVVTENGLINIDFADIKTVMSDSGIAMMGRGTGSGGDKALTAVKNALDSPLLEDIDIQNASGIIVSVHGGLDMKLEEIQLVGQEVQKIASKDAHCIIGNSVDASISGEIMVTVIATGLNNKETKESQPTLSGTSSLLKTQKPTPKPTPPSKSEIPSFLRRNSASS